MNRTDGAKASYGDWMDAYQCSYADPRSIVARRCPSCGERQLKMIFIVKIEGAETGTVAFWCNSCLQGLMPTRAPIPRGGDKILEGLETVPNYSFVFGEEEM
jgi:hypothetical protein